ncbi:TonB-dependent receptor [Chitinophaga alhagiae]|nr:TonB-dependent receptor [Chitinophaga alhagiae]
MSFTPAHAQSGGITLKLKNAPLSTVMDSIQQQSAWRFSYDLALTPLLKQTTISVNVTNEPVEKVVPLLFEKTGINYRITDNTILLSKNNPPKQDVTDQPVLFQTIKGKVVDKESQAPLPNASITVLNQPEVRGAITDNNGRFSLKVPVGRQVLQCSFLGYQKYTTADVLVISGKETFLTIELQEAAENMQTVTIHANEGAPRALNSMATVSTHTLSAEDAARFAGGYNDPARMVTAFAGVTSGGSGRNNMIVRGNSPKGILWKLEGIEIPSPNHFSQGQGDGGGIFSIIEADALSNFDFFTSAFPAEYGNALSGILDLNLRKGNTDKMEYGLQLGMIGTQASIEGPLSKHKKSSFLFNYRYGNLQFLDKLNLVSLGENSKPPVFQDFNLHVHLPTQKAGDLSVFAIGGISKTGRSPGRNTSGGSMGIGNESNDETENHQMGVVGIKHMQTFANKKTYLRSVVSASWLSDRYENTVLEQDNQHILTDSSRFSYPTVRFSTMLNHKFSAGSVIRAGVNYNHFFYSIYGKRNNRNTGPDIYADQSGNTSSAEGFLQWKYRLAKNLEINTGLHATLFFLNNSNAIEPRFGAKWRTGRNAAISYGFGMHSRIEPISLYLYKMTGADGSITQPNLDLGLTKAVHHVLGYEWAPAKNLRFKLEAYYQYLYDVPVKDDSTSTFSILNTMRGIADSAYANKGKGYNKGIELTMDRSFSDNYYLIFSGTVFDSKYVPGNGKKYNTYFNTGWQVNGLAGKDFKVGRSKQNLLSLNAKAVVHGGFRYSQAQMATNSSGMPYLYYLPEDTYAGQTDKFMQLDAGIKFRKNNRHYSWILSLDVQNLTNRENVLQRDFYIVNGGAMRAEDETDLGIIPILNLKVEF